MCRKNINKHHNTKWQKKFKFINGTINVSKLHSSVKKDTVRFDFLYCPDRRFTKEMSIRERYKKTESKN